MPETATGEVAYVAQLPNCNFCEILAKRLNMGKIDITKARYDFRTRSGSWANGCSVHYQMHRMHRDLGTGKGQRLEVRE